MYEKVSPSHPDKIADRIAGAIVDCAYAQEKDPRIAVEVLIGHRQCLIISESSVIISDDQVDEIVRRIAGKNISVQYVTVGQNVYLADNQALGFRCGDNGIFKGMPVTEEQLELTRKAKVMYAVWPYDGKYIQDGSKLIICHSNAPDCVLRGMYKAAIINPLGEWTGGLDVDTGATNRKLGSDMGDSVTGGGLHGKDLSKADVSVNIHAFLKANRTGEPVFLSCAIGDDVVDGVSYKEIVEEAREYILSLGGFEKFAEWGLIR